MVGNKDGKNMVNVIAKNVVLKPKMTRTTVYCL